MASAGLFTLVDFFGVGRLWMVSVGAPVFAVYIWACVVAVLQQFQLVVVCVVV